MYQIPNMNPGSVTLLSYCQMFPAIDVHTPQVQELNSEAWKPPLHSNFRILQYVASSPVNWE